MVEADQVTEYVVKRWVRYGHDRLYVETADGVRLGYWDVKTSAAVVEDDTDRTAVATAARNFMGESPQVAAPAAWTDLSLNQPGRAAREQAVASRQAAPVKTVLTRILGIHTDERAWRIGADGEQAVAAQLAKLGPEWQVLHSIPVGSRGSDIDHLVVGPAGVYTINTKHHPSASIWVGGNTFLVNGQRQPYVRNSRHEASRASRILTAATGFPVFVTGLIVVMGAQGGFTVREQPAGGDVHVLARRAVHRWLTRRPIGALTADQTHIVYDTARIASTWQAS